MKHLSPLLDVILGMLLAFVAIAAVSGARTTEDSLPEEGADGAASAIELRVARPFFPLELRVNERAGERDLNADELSALILERGPGVEVRITDPALYQLLRQLETHSVSPRVTFVSGAPRARPPD